MPGPPLGYKLSRSGTKLVKYLAKCRRSSKYPAQHICMFLFPADSTSGKSENYVYVDINYLTPGRGHEYVSRRVLYKPSSLSEVPHELSDATSAVCSRKAGPAGHIFVL